MFEIINHYSFSTIPSTSSFLDLGGALTAAGLICTAYQFRTPAWDLVLRIRNTWQKNLIWWLGSAGLFVILLRVFIFESNLDRFLTCPLNIPIFYEIIAYILFIFSPLSIVFFSRRKEVLNNKNHQHFHNELVKEISKGNEKNINAAFELFIANFNQLCLMLKGLDKETSYSAKITINIVLSDNHIVEILTTQRLDCLINVFYTIEKNSLNQNDLIVCIPKIISNLFLSTQSFFYRHIERDGLAISSNIFHNIFASKHLLKNLNLFVDPNLYNLERKKITSEGIRVFIFALSIAIETFKEAEKIPSQHITSGLKYLGEIFNDICIEINTKERLGANITHELRDERHCLWLIAHFLGRLESIENILLNTTNTNFHYTVNITIANTLSKTFEGLSYIEDSKYTYHIVVELFHGLEFLYEQTAYYREIFEKQMWDSIAKSIVKRLYPATLRVYLVYFGMLLTPNSFTINSWMNDQVERVRRLLYIDLKPLLDQNSTMVNKKNMNDELLPKDLIYDKGIFVYIDKNSEQKVIHPPKDFTSALKL